YALTLRHAKAVPEQQKAVWFEQHAFASYCCGLGDAAVSSWREAIALRHALGDTRAEGDDLVLVVHELFSLGRATEAADAGRASVQMLQDGGACPQLARSLVNMAELGAWAFDPTAAHYAARAITVGAQLGDDAVVLRARGIAALTRVLCTDT